ncbi:tRNAHis guanylyltransferase, putative [Plasmodium gaboni]|uniref:tRNA(His) guanylyltransferase n=1 Tax=Plasmodium gaboni TaxID=647221 RepID=A0ABY1UKI0_9APIC|nr:tRNAHis guanylyltransferase, putative [Plasmodium gaboni]
MANSKFSYVKLFEEERKILLNCYFIVRIDGCDFKHFVKAHNYNKPNDIEGLNLMNECALDILKKFDDIDLCYGHSDEYSFLFNKSTKLWNRRYDKILTNVVSYFTSCFLYKWKDVFQKELLYAPSFDARIVVYPNEKEIKDYFSWRQVDCHINTQYNECFWNLIRHGNYTNDEAHKFLLTTQTKDKNELLFSRFNINYNNLPEIFRRGTIIIRNKTFQKNNEGLGTIYNNDTTNNIDDNNNNDNDTSNNIDHNNNNNNNNTFIDNNDIKKFEKLRNESLPKFIISHENLVSEKFWDKYDYIFKKKKDLEKK